jgi:UDP-N-acetyl-D-glucosamine dehydrogenase
VSVTSRVAVIGAGYVGLPLAVALAEGGRSVTCIDVSADAVRRILAGDSYISDVPSDKLATLVAAGVLTATTDPASVAECDDIVLCVPTPLSRNREPDLSYVMDATRTVGRYLRKGHLVVLESTTYPGTTRDELGPSLEQASGLVAGVDFHLAMSPERIDPGRTDYTVRTMPKIVGGLTPACTERAVALYAKAVDTLVPVSAPETAELAKLLENIFRSVNIALMNEMAMLCDRMGIDVWEVADAAATKPFGFMRFTPGPGLGGHCIPLDPFYLSWRARQFDFHTEFIELAGKVNQNMPYFCREKVARALNGQSKPLRGSAVLVVGVAYKPDIDDTRESPALKLIELLRDEGCAVSYHDPFVPRLREFDLESVPLDPAMVSSDCVVVVTNHGSIDYEDVVARSRLVVDFPNATGRAGTSNGKVVKL